MQAIGFLKAAIVFRDEAAAARSEKHTAAIATSPEQAGGTAIGAREQED